MKRILQKKAFWQSVLTAMVVAIFTFIAMSSLSEENTTQQKRKLPDGRVEVATYWKDYGKSRTITGNVDAAGRFHGPVTIVYERNFERTATEDVSMFEGLRHGTSSKTKADGTVERICYWKGRVRSKGRCEEKALSVSLTENEQSAFEVFSNEFPWFAFQLHAFGFDSGYMKAYLDTLETILYSNEFSEDEFDNYYDDALDILEETPYDSIIQFNSLLSFDNGSDIILSHEFRLATIHSYTQADSNTYNIINSTYRNYLLELNAFGVTDTDFEEFCIQYDDIMSSYDPISPDDFYFLDSLDRRMSRTMDSIYSSEKKSSSDLKSLNRTLLSTIGKEFRAFRNKDALQINVHDLTMTPKEVSEVVLATIIEDFLKGDLIKTSVKEAYHIKERIITLPTVVTVFSGNPTSTSAIITGSIMEDGGGEITSRGIAWGSVYNPTTDNQYLSSGTGSGDFNATITGLTEGETYYARAFAINSAGKAYGDCVMFVTGEASGIDPGQYTRIINVYPNPASDFLTIEFKAEEPGDLLFCIYDLSGKNILRRELNGIVQGENAFSINISQIRSGYYTCRIEGADLEYAVQKVLISR